MPTPPAPDDPRALVAAALDATRAHGSSWGALVPDAFTVNDAAEAAEEAAYAAMAAAKARLRDHVHATYGITLQQLCSLAMP
jgi:urocanate hydratase